MARPLSHPTPPGLRPVPELVGTGTSLRIPELRNPPLTHRIAAIVDHPAFQRLRRVRQLGPTHLVYPGAVHTRFEHSLGVYDMARQYLLALTRHEEVAASLAESDVLTLLLAALLHDIGHYPFAHSLEALHVPDMETPRHELLMARIVRGEIAALRGDRPLAKLIRERFEVDPEAVISLVTAKPAQHAREETRLLATILSSGVDADKADYLERDSVHMGVGYGRHWDRARFLDSLCPGRAGDAIAITDKGKVSAELFIFARYTMFSEAYWHHTVRAVSAMVEQALGDWRRRDRMEGDRLIERLLQDGDDAFLERVVRESPSDSLAARRLRAMTGGARSLFKRVLTLSRVYEDRASQSAWDRVAQLDADGLIALRGLLAARLSVLLAAPVSPDDLLVDTPPRDKDRIETIDVAVGSGAGRRFYRLEELSKVVQGIAADFVKVVKKVRIFVSPAVRDRIVAGPGSDACRDLLLDAVLGFTPDSHPQRSLW